MLTLDQPLSILDLQGLGKELWSGIAAIAAADGGTHRSAASTTSAAYLRS